MVENKWNHLQKESVPSEMQQSTGFQGSKGPGGLASEEKAASGKHYHEASYEEW